jgi:hypothetical protein
MALLYLFKRALEYFARRAPRALQDPSAPPGAFAEHELAELEAVWRELIKRVGLDLGPGGVVRKDGGLIIDLQTTSPRPSQLHITKRWVTFKGAAGSNGDAIIASLIYFKEKNISVTIEGDRGFVRRVLALAADVGVMIDPRLLAPAGSRPIPRPRSTTQDEIIPQRGDPNSPLTHHWARRPG